MAQIKILVVEDEANIALAVKMVVLRAVSDCSVALADDGFEALELLADDSFSLIISDWNMPNMSGIELLNAVRRDERTEHLPFLLLTARNDISGVQTMFDSAITDYVSKPFDNDVLAAKVLTLLAKPTALG